MSHQHPSKRSAKSTDDLKRIQGIGPVIERRLKKAGIRTFAQMATYSPPQLAQQVVGVSAARVDRFSWIQQARKLARTKSKRIEPKHTEMPVATHTATQQIEVASSRQHYATFTIELLLNDDDSVRRMRVVHVQSSEELTCAGWDEARLVAFMIKRIKLHLPAPTPVSVADLVAAVESLTARDEGIAEQTDQRLSPTAISAASSATTLTGRLRIGEIALTMLVEAEANEQAPHHEQHMLLSHNQPFHLRIMLDLTEVHVTPDDALIHFSAAVYAKNLAGSVRVCVGETRGIIAVSDRVAVSIAGRSLPKGVYRLEASTMIGVMDVDEANPKIKSWLEGGLLQVY